MGMLKQALAGVRVPDRRQQLRPGHPSRAVSCGSLPAQPWKTPPRARLDFDHKEILIPGPTSDKWMFSQFV